MVDSYDDHLDQFIKDLDYKNNGFPRWYKIGFRDQYGWTALMYWCEYRKGEPIPKELLQELEIKTNNGWTALMYWCYCRLGEPIPPELFQEIGLRTVYGGTALMVWCRERLGEPIPPELFQELKLTIKSGRTALMYWCMYRKGEPIPPELFQELHLIAYDGWTPLMEWCRYRKEPIPPELLIYLGCQTAKGNTASIFWKQSNPDKHLPDCLEPEETMELIPFVPPDYRSKTLDFKLL